ncbi:DUF692 family protein [bacterium]|nr:DUF692 family protein [bacterium]MBP9808358.1 DUF692 family protein [bacterium]
MLQEDFLAATLPLFSNDEVEILEWSPDIGWAAPTMPEWANELLDFYSSANSLYGHGVNYSPMSAEWTAVDSEWIENLKRELEARKFVHFSEHFGFSRIGHLQQGAPLPVPFTTEAIRAGQFKLEKLAHTTGGRIGLENLALAFSKRDAMQQGRFLEDLLRPFDGFVLLDLHNLYCQMENFSLSAEELLGTYPLERVREIHISGGSWSESQAAQTKRKSKPTLAPASVTRIRRDTHDNEVPDEVLALLPLVLANCPNVEAVILERIGGTMPTAEQQARFRDDYRAIAKLIELHTLRQTVGDDAEAMAKTHITQVELSQGRGTLSRECSQSSDQTEILRYQKKLMELLQSEQSPERIIAELSSAFEGELAEYANLSQPQMLAVGQELVKKWTQ